MLADRAVHSAGPVDGDVAVPSMDQFAASTTFMTVALAVDSWAKICGAKDGLPLDVPTVTLVDLRKRLPLMGPTTTQQTQAVNKLLRLHCHWVKIVCASVTACKLKELIVFDGGLTCALLVWLMAWLGGFDPWFDGGLIVG